MARKLWINLVESFSLHKTMDEPPKHFTASLGFGHVLPMDDLLMHKEGGLPLQSFTLHDPNNATTELRLPAPESYTMKEASCGLTVETGDFAVHKFSIGDDAIKGTYQLAAESTDFFISQYEDQQGHMVWDPKPMDEVAQDQKILASFRTKIYAKAFTSAGEWNKPQSLGHELELIPETDLTQVMPGEPVTFDVQYMGEPFTCTQGNMEYVVAASNTYGGEGGGSTEGFFLSAYAINGKVRFAFPSAGQWIVSAFSNQWVRDDDNWKHLNGKCQRVFHCASVAFNVKAF
jgi:uncharacterized GH25 family protein